MVYGLVHTFISEFKLPLLETGIGVFRGQIHLYTYSNPKNSTLVLRGRYCCHYHCKVKGEAAPYHVPVALAYVTESTVLMDAGSTSKRALAGDCLLLHSLLLAPGTLLRDLLWIGHRELKCQGSQGAGKKEGDGACMLSS